MMLKNPVGSDAAPEIMTLLMTPLYLDYATYIIIIIFKHKPAHPTVDIYADEYTADLVVFFLFLFFHRTSVYSGIFCSFLSTPNNVMVKSGEAGIFSPLFINTKIDYNAGFCEKPLIRWLSSEKRGIIATRYFMTGFLYLHFLRSTDAVETKNCIF